MMYTEGYGDKHELLASKYILDGCQNILSGFFKMATAVSPTKNLSRAGQQNGDNLRFFFKR